jgi:hypothetical protein
VDCGFAGETFGEAADGSHVSSPPVKRSPSKYSAQ